MAPGANVTPYPYKELISLCRGSFSFLSQIVFHLLKLDFICKCLKGCTSTYSFVLYLVVYTLRFNKLVVIKYCDDTRPDARQDHHDERMQHSRLNYLLMAEG